MLCACVADGDADPEAERNGGRRRGVGGAGAGGEEGAHRHHQGPMEESLQEPEERRGPEVVGKSGTFVAAWNGFCSMRWSTADAEIKLRSAESLETSEIPSFKAWNRSGRRREM